MSFIRPELALKARRWREPLLWAGVGGLGLVLLISGGGLARLLLGGALTCVGVAFLPGAIRRVRLSDPILAVGAVQIDEGRIAYFGPMGGAFIDVAELERVEMIGRHWRLTEQSGAQVYIPRGATGADRLPDALSVLPGLNLGAALPHSGHTLTAPALLWQRGGASALASRPRLD